MGLVGTAGSQAGPPSRFQSRPKPVRHSKRYADRPRGIGFLAASTGAFGGAGGPPGSQLADGGRLVAPMLRGVRVGWPAQRAKTWVQDCPALMAMADVWCRRHRSCRFCG